MTSSQHTERILGAARLSRDSDTSTSVASQREGIGSVVTYRGGQLVTITEDSDVSGGLSPFDRPGLGPWLTDADLIGQWDTLVVSKLDRLSRSLVDFAMLIKWAEKHGKNIVSKAESIDLTMLACRLMAKIIILFAEFERERISERHLEGKSYRRQSAAWSSGNPPFGYSVERRGSMLYLVPGADAGAYRDMAARAMKGDSAGSIGADLGWTTLRVIDVLRNPVYCGYVVTREVLGTDDSGKRQHSKHWTYVTDDEGAKVRHDAPLISVDDWQRLQTALDSRRITRAHSATVRLLSSVAECGNCGQTLSYRQTGTRPGGPAARRWRPLPERHRESVPGWSC